MARRQFENISLNEKRNFSDGPLKKLSVDLIHTYRKINDQYYKSRQKKNPDKLTSQPKTTAKLQPRDDDSKLDLKVKENEYWDVDDDSNGPNRRKKFQFKIEEILGRGSFGQVVKAVDFNSGRQVAIKVIKNDASFFNQAQIEIRLLKLLANKMQQNPDIEYHIVKFHDQFMYKQHLCLIFELLSHSLYELLKNTNFNGVSLNLTRKFAQQLCQSLVKLYQLKIIHCDLKPENILLVNPKRSTIKIIDFGSSCKFGEGTYLYIQSRYYRSPEVLLNLPYDMKIDMWSLGCILVEMHTGEALFAGQNEQDQMARIVEVLGLPPAHMIDASPVAANFFKKGDDGSWVCRHSRKYHLPGTRNLRDILTRPSERRRGGPSCSSSSVDYDKFSDLLYKMLEYDPAKRVTPLEALRDQFFTKPESSYSTHMSEPQPVVITPPAASAIRR